MSCVCQSFYVPLNAADCSFNYCGANNVLYAFAWLRPSATLLRVRCTRPGDLLISREGGKFFSCFPCIYIRYGA